MSGFIRPLHFLPLFGEKGLRIPVSVITDADPFEVVEIQGEVQGELNEEAIEDLLAEASYLEEAGAPEDEEPDEAEAGAKKKKVKRVEVYPSLGDEVRISSNTAKMKGVEDAFVKIFHGVKTLEYDLALLEENRKAMLAALGDLHPRIAKALGKIVNAQPDNTAKAKALFCGMFERKDSSSNVQKGRYAQALAEHIAKQPGCKVPEYMVQAIRHVCKGVNKHEDV